MLFVHRVPAPPLNASIESIWYCENNPRPFALERVLPTGAAQLIVNLKEDQTRMYRPEGETASLLTSSGSILSGVASRYGFIDTAEQECVAGVAFKPGGTPAFFPIPAQEMRDADIPVELLWGRRRASELREQLLEAASPARKLDVLERALADAWRPPAMHPGVAFALRTFSEWPETARVGMLADSAGLSTKRFIERFKILVGLPPKSYCRILRFQRALACAEMGGPVNWTRVALDCGYFDQAHFIHDFRSFAGITPTGYQARRTQFRNHVKFLQSDAAAEMR